MKIFVGDEVRLDQHAVARLDEVAERVPVGRTGATRIESKHDEAALDHFVDRVWRRKRRQTYIVHPGPRHRRDRHLAGDVARVSTNHPHTLTISCAVPFVNAANSLWYP